MQLAMYEDSKLYDSEWRAAVDTWMNKIQQIQPLQGSLDIQRLKLSPEKESHCSSCAMKNIKINVPELNHLLIFNSHIKISIRLSCEGI